MSKVLMPNSRNGTADSLQTGGTIVGGVVGGIYGGPAGAAEGASAGGAIGGKVGGVLGGNAQTPQAVSSDVKSGPMARRMEEPGVELQKADQALSQLPPQYQDQYGPMIRRARMLDEQQKGIA